MTGIAIAGLDAEGFTNSNFELGENAAMLIGSIAILQQRLIENMKTE